MNERWKMNRIGFVNFWLYDEEDFEFEDGKLLLRGQNGSGKSITTQSFIPVSYTHLTLPTIHSVYISVGAASFKKKQDIYSLASSQLIDNE